MARITYDDQTAAAFKTVREVPLADGSADGAWLSLVIHHIPDLEAAARDIRRVLRPGAPVLIRQGFPGRTNRVELVHWFPETARTVDTYPSVEQTCQAFAAAGFSRGALEQIPETYRTTLAEFLAQADTFRRADTTMRNLTERNPSAAKNDSAAPRRTPRRHPAP